MRTVTFFIPIPRTRAGSTTWSALTTFSISFRRVAMRATLILQWIGCGGTMSTESGAKGGDFMNRVTHFEIYTDDPEQVQPFYQNVFGWKFNKFEGGPIEYWLVTTGGDNEPGINGGLTRPREGQNQGMLNTIA